MRTNIITHINECGKEKIKDIIASASCCGALVILSLACHCVFSCQDCNKKFVYLVRKICKIIFRYALLKNYTAIFVTLSLKNETNFLTAKEKLYKAIRKLKDKWLTVKSAKKIFARGLWRYETSLRKMRKKDGTRKYSEKKIREKIKMQKKIFRYVEQKIRLSKGGKMRLVDIIRIGCEVLDVTRGKNGSWNVHLHGLWCVTCPLPQSFVAELLRVVAGDEDCHVYLQKIRDEDHVARYIGKYLGKNSKADLTYEDRLDIDRLIRGSKKIRIVGKKDDRKALSELRAEAEEEKKDNRKCRKCGHQGRIDYKVIGEIKGLEEKEVRIRIWNYGSAEFVNLGGILFSRENQLVTGVGAYSGSAYIFEDESPEIFAEIWTDAYLSLFGDYSEV